MTAFTIEKQSKISELATLITPIIRNVATIIEYATFIMITPYLILLIILCLQRPDTSASGFDES